MGAVDGWEGLNRSSGPGGWGVLGEVAEPPVQHGGGRVGILEGAHRDRTLEQGLEVVAGEGEVAGAVEQAGPLLVAWDAGQAVVSDFLVEPVVGCVAGGVFEDGAEPGE